MAVNAVAGCERLRGIGRPSMTLREIRETLGAEVLCGESRLGLEIRTACGCDLMSDVLAFTGPDSLLLTGLTNPQVVRTAEMAEIAAVCFVRGKEPEAQTVRLAAEKGLPLFRTRLPMFESCGRLHARGLAGCSELSVCERRTG